MAEAAKASTGIGGLLTAAEVDNVVVLGWGAAARPATCWLATGGPFVPVPLVVAKGYSPPSFVGLGTLCFAVSFSGDTEETLEAAQAAAAGARMVVVTPGARWPSRPPAGRHR